LIINLRTNAKAVSGSFFRHFLQQSSPSFITGTTRMALTPTATRDQMDPSSWRPGVVKLCFLVYIKFITEDSNAIHTIITTR
jgi:hypothetical protein